MDTETVSKEAHQRITAERDQARKELAEHQALLAKANTALTEALGWKAYVHHRAATDQTMKALDAELDLVGPQLRGIAEDQLSEAVSRVAAQLDAFRGGTMLPTPKGEENGEVTEPAAPPEMSAPQFNPNPGASGVPLQPEKIEVGDKKFDDLYRTGGLPAVRAAINDGTITLSPEVRANHGL